MAFLERLLGRGDIDLAGGVGDVGNLRVGWVGRRRGGGPEAPGKGGRSRGDLHELVEPGHSILPLIERMDCCCCGKTKPNQPVSSRSMYAGRGEMDHWQAYCGPSA